MKLALITIALLGLGIAGMAIKNLILDFGGVVINIDHKLTCDAMENLGIQDFESKFSKASQSEIFDMQEKGELSDKEFLNALRLKCHRKVTDEQLIEAWNAMLGTERMNDI